MEKSNNNGKGINGTYNSGNNLQADKHSINPHQNDLPGGGATDPGSREGNHSKKAKQEKESDFRYFYSGKKLL